MDPIAHQNDLKWVRRANTRLSIALIVSVVAIFAAMVLIMILSGRERTIVVPPALDKSFWVDRNRVSRDYLEQMAEFVIWLALDVNPYTVQRKQKVLLSYVGPDHGTLKSEMDVQATRLRSTNASTSFEIQQLVTDEEAKSVLAVGRLRRQINGDDIGEPARKTYKIEFDYSYGRLQLVSFKEVPPDEDRN
jgi:conjugal transfer pilus assembly protein TraE